MTEDEAKTKWCPLVRSRNLLDLMVRSGNAPVGPDVDILCIASACMAWRWDGYFNDTGMFLKRVSDGSFHGRQGEPPVGHCGLAGGAA